MKAIKRGRNAIQTTLKIAKLKTDWKQSATQHWGNIYKATLNRLNTLEFRELSHRGVNLFSRSKHIPSRGYYKLQDIINQTKMTPYGNVLNLCCGSGGWEAFMGPKNMVTKIRSITLGPGPEHEGHNPFTQLPFIGREKVDLCYGDARSEPKGDYQWILFDGGESSPDAQKEASRFLELLKSTTEKHVNHMSNFIWKILTPTDEDTMAYLREIQDKTNKGAYIRSTQSKPTTLELYFVSKPRTNLEQDARNLLQNVMTRAEVYEGGLTPGPDNDLPLLVEQPPSNWRIELKKPDMSKAIKMLGPTMCEAGRPFLHWKSLAIYPFGPRGTNAQPRMTIAKRLLGDLMDVMPEINQWTLTDTAPVGFNRVFSRKIDTIPVETHQHNDYLEGCY